jgi:uncharacterized protein (TIGR03437 family)
VAAACAALPAFASAAPSLDSVVNAANFVQGPLVPGSLATLFGSGLAGSTVAPGTFPLPVYTGNASVYVNGVAAPLLYVSSSQVNFQVPWEIPLGQASVVMIVDDAVSNTLSATVAVGAPGVFKQAVLVSATAQAARVPQGRTVHSGEYITVFATGLGAIDAPPPTGAPLADYTLTTLKNQPTITIAGIPVTADFAGLAPPGPNQYSVGVYQVNVKVPANVPAGDVTLMLSVGGVSDSATISVASGRADSIVKYTELGPNTNSVRAITSQDTCPSITLDGTSQTMGVRAAPTLPFYPILTCETTLASIVKSASIEGQTMPLPAVNPTRLTVIGDTGCRMDTTTSQACNNPTAWPVAQVGRSAVTTNPQVLIHNGDYHYREAPCMIAGCAGSPWGYIWDVWREDLFTPLGPMMPTAPWVFVRGNHESCDRAGEGWFRFLDPRPMPSSCQVYTDPYSIDLGTVQLIHLDSASADDSIVPADPTIVAAYVPQFAKIAQLAGSNAWIVTHRPIWGIRSNANSNIVLQAASQNVLPPGVQLVLSGHTHNFQTFTFSPTRAPQLVIGNGGDNLGANPSVPIVGFTLGNATVTQGTSLSLFGFSTMTPVQGGGWSITSLDVAGNPVDTCTVQPGAIACAK